MKKRKKNSFKFLSYFGIIILFVSTIFIFQGTREEMKKIVCMVGGNIMGLSEDMAMAAEGLNKGISETGQVLGEVMEISVVGAGQAYMNFSEEMVRASHGFGKGLYKSEEGLLKDMKGIILGIADNLNIVKKKNGTKITIKKEFTKEKKEVKNNLQSDSDIKKIVSQVKGASIKNKGIAGEDIYGSEEKLINGLKNGDGYAIEYFNKLIKRILSERGELIKRASSIIGNPLSLVKKKEELIETISYIEKAKDMADKNNRDGGKVDNLENGVIGNIEEEFKNIKKEKGITDEEKDEVKEDVNQFFSDEIAIEQIIDEDDGGVIIKAILEKGNNQECFYIKIQKQ